MLTKFVLFLVVFCAQINISVTSQLSKVLKNYEILERGSIRKSVVKRGVENVAKSNYNRIEDLTFSAFSKNLRLFLTPKDGLLSSNFEAYSVDGDLNRTKIYVDPDEFYEGHVFGEPVSKISAHFDNNGALTAFIQTERDTYIIEPAWRHVENVDVGDSLIYKASDMRQNFESQDEDHHTCGFVQIDAETLVNTSSFSKNEFFKDNEVHKINKRATESEERNYVLNKKRCPVKLVADYRFFNGVGGGDSATTVRYLISLIDRVNLIYTNTVWQDSENAPGITNMGFVIKNITVHTNYTNEYDHYNSVQDDFDVGKLLGKFSEAEGNDRYCLVHLFTYRAFAGGVLGLGYIASPHSGHAGGVCSIASLATPSGNKLVYYNTALTSLRSTHGTRVVTREADIVTAHEFGHNWGSHHDPSSAECAPPSAKGGPFIMYMYSVSGYDPNNKKFSPCSQRLIKAVLESKRDLCFEEEQKSFCGNRRVENGEECDEAFLGDAATDNGCCTAECKFKPGARCSPKNSLCCTDKCQFASANKSCRAADSNNCREAGFCSGKNPDCPESKPTSDGTSCLDEGVCKNGECLSFCEKYDMRPCLCENVTESCYRCCRPMNETLCRPFVMHPLYAKPQVVPDNTRCIHGYCKGGHCKKDVQDFAEHLWNIIEKWDINFFFKFLHDNIVGTVIVVTLVFWIPISCWIHKIDQRRVEELQKEDEWNMNGEFFVPDNSGIEVIRDVKTVEWNQYATRV